MNRKSVTLSAMVLSFTLGAATWAASRDDAQKVLSDLHHANQMEIQMGQLAKDKGTSDAVRSYGDQLVKDHTEADKQVQDLSQKDNIALLASTDNDQKAMVDISNKTGASFDKAFVSQMIDDHKKDIAKLQNAEKTLPPSDVRDLVAKLLPTLQEHLAMAQHIQKNNS